jgi:GLPGLI family protein
VYDNTFLIQDSLTKIEWRITNDTRTIAGFECRKAVGRMLDSVYVIAFYTDQILTTGGPESFTGLPGMILGAAIPRINTTWFATKLELTPVTPEQIAPPKKGKKVNTKELLEQLQTAMKDWQRFGKRNIWLIMI